MLDCNSNYYSPTLLKHNRAFIATFYDSFSSELKCEILKETFSLSGLVPEMQ